MPICDKIYLGDNMNNIHVMSDNLANKIAAGEVVEKTMNVVKELVENAIDAKASSIKIELIDSGVKMIKVTDNGIGMNREDATLCLERHATSKLMTLDDLFNIESLGFRGEALPSIAAVSKMEIKTTNGIDKTIVEIDGGKIINVSDTDISEGTIITVKDLFYNTPVRLKYLKNLYIELANITDYVNKMALSYPNIRFSLINNDKSLLNTDGSNNLLKVINSIYGVDITKKMIKLDNENDDYSISGYMSYPEVTKPNRNSIITFVNGRLIKNNELNKAITDSYHTYIPKDKFPIFILNIETDPILIDINIHPTKMDIKFSKIKELKELINSTITKQLENLLLIPEKKAKDKEFIAPKSLDIFNNDEKTVSYKSEDITTDYSISEELTLDLIYGVEKEEEIIKEKNETSRIKYMHPVGIALGTYIIAENEDGMYLIDQHAAQERINYEKYLKEMSSEDRHVSDLLIPISIELTNKDYLILKENINILNDLGFVVEEFGINTIMIRTAPIFLPKGYEEQAIRKIIDIIVENESFSKEKFVEKTAITLSCKMAIKANDHISIEEAEELLNTLRKCSNPFTCPHGRPTIITYSKYELERLFKRSMN